MPTAFTKAMAASLTAAAALSFVAPSVEAAPTRKEQKVPASSLKKTSLKAHADLPKALARPGSCTEAQFSHSVRADLVFDLKTGTVISSNIPVDKHDTTIIHPASLTKIEAIKEVMRRVKTGLWSLTDKFEVKLPPPHKAVKLNPAEMVLASANPSLNVFNSVADGGFIEGMAAHLKEIGALKATYLSATGLPTSADIRNNHVTTLSDLARSVRDFELNYATPEISRDVLGLPRFTGIWQLSIAGLHRTTHTIKILEDAKGAGAKPYHGVTSGKSGFTCEFGFGSYVRYEDKGRPFIVFTAGHVNPALRDQHTINLIEVNKDAMDHFVEPMIAVIPMVELAPLPKASTVSLQTLPLLEPLR